MIHASLVIAVKFGRYSLEVKKKLSVKIKQLYTLLIIRDAWRQLVNGSLFLFKTKQKASLYFTNWRHLSGIINKVYSDLTCSVLHFKSKEKPSPVEWIQCYNFIIRVYFRTQRNEITKQFWFMNSLCLFECKKCKNSRSRIIEVTLWINWYKLIFLSQEDCQHIDCFTLADNFVISRAAITTKFHNYYYEAFIRIICEYKVQQCNDWNSEHSLQYYFAMDDLVRASFRFNEDIIACNVGFFQLQVTSRVIGLSFFRYSCNYV